MKKGERCYLRGMFARGVWLYLLLVAVASCVAGEALAQPTSDSTSRKKTLKEATVTGKQNKTHDTKVNDFAPGLKLTTIDTQTLQQYKMQSIATMLTQQVPVYVKSYSFNGVATLNFRGSSAAQSQVFWNGVPIQNAALGIADVSTLPVMFMNRVNIVYGGSSALYGSGNVGGALLLECGDVKFGKAHSLSLSGSAGSYGQYAGGIEGAVAGSRWYAAAKLLMQSADNDFAYTNNTGEKMHMANSKLHSTAALLHIAYKSGEKSVVGLHAWVQQYDRMVPPALFETRSVKKQVDGSVRILLDWNNKGVQSNWYARSSFVKDEIRYDDDAIALHTASTVYQYYQEAGWKKQLGKWGQVLLFVPVQLAWINAPITHNIKHQDKIAVAGAYDIRLLHDKLNIAVNARMEAIDSEGIMTNMAQKFLLPGADASYTLTKWLSIRANVQRTYRAPTLNELFYYPGGNAALKPEQGWNEDAGYTLSFVYNRFAVYHDLSVFNRDIKDWIIWLGGAIWTPHNIAQVHSRGLEAENRVDYTVNNWKLHLRLNTAYVLATTVNSYLYNDGSIGRQIPYTPRYNGQLNIGFTYKKLFCNYNHTYTGYRFTVSDESFYLQPYQTGNVQLMYTTLLKGHQLQLTGQCNNIWNAQYSVVFSRPMPGVNWLAGLKIGIL